MCSELPLAGAGEWGCLVHLREAAQTQMAESCASPGCSPATAGGFVLPLLEAGLEVTSRPCLGKCVITPVKCDKCVMARAGSVTFGRGGWQERASAVPALLLSLAHMLGVALRMFSGACRECSLSWRGPGGSLALWMCHSSYTGAFRAAFLFSSCLAGKEREEENSSYPWDVETGRNT